MEMPGSKKTMIFFSDILHKKYCNLHSLQSMNWYFFQIGAEIKLSSEFIIYFMTNGSSNCASLRLDDVANGI